MEEEQRQFAGKGRAAVKSLEQNVLNEVSLRAEGEDDAPLTNSYRYTDLKMENNYQNVFNPIQPPD